MTDKRGAEREAEALRNLSQESLEVLDWFIEKFERKKHAITRQELEERRKLGPLSIDRLSEFTNSRLRSLDVRIARCKKAKQQKQPGATQASGPARAASEQLPVGAASGIGTGRRMAVNGFITKLAEAGHKIIRKNIWTVAGYRNRSEFERWQRDDSRTTKSAVANFGRVLGMTPEGFMVALKKRTRR